MRSRRTSMIVDQTPRGTARADRRAVRTRHVGAEPQEDLAVAVRRVHRRRPGHAGRHHGRRDGAGRASATTSSGPRPARSTSAHRRPSWSGAHRDDNEMLHAENRDAVAAGIQNLLLGATTLGLASFWSTPALTQPACRARPLRLRHPTTASSASSTWAGPPRSAPRPNARSSRSPTSRPDSVNRNVTFDPAPCDGFVDRGWSGENGPVNDPRQTIVTLDVEGVLVPEIWIAVAERTGIEGLRRTTRDEPNYDVLMRYRLDLLAEHGLTMSLIEDVIAGLVPLDGARDLPRRAARRDAGHPAVGHVRAVRPSADAPARTGPTVLCHRLVVARRPDRRLPAPPAQPEAACGRGTPESRTTGSSPPATATTTRPCLSAADHGYLFHAPANVIAEFPQFPALDTYDDLLAAIRSHL